MRPGRQYVQFTAQAAANAIVVRYSVPDTANGGGADYTISFYKNGSFVGELPVTSKYSWLYGAYPFTNAPSAGSPRHFYDEVRTNGVSISAGDTIRLQVGVSDTATNYVIDLVDLENVAPPLTRPTNSVSVAASPYNADTNGVTDATTALQNCVNGNTGKIVWMPPGTYLITGAINLPSNTTIKGAGMWYTTLVGNPALYNTPSRRVHLSANGSNIQISDLAIVGKLTYRNPSEANDGLAGNYGTGSRISRVWVEHTSTGAWLTSSRGLTVDSCRIRNTIADAINASAGMQNTIVTNCTARGCGDDSFGIWPYNSNGYTPENNLITHCTALCSFLGNGGVVYGGANNCIEDCLFYDITYGCGVLLSTTFNVTAIFSGTTVVQRCDVIRCGGYDQGYKWRAAVQMCLDTNAAGSAAGINGLNLNNLNITNSISDGMSIIGTVGTLTNAVMSNVSIPNYGLGVSGRNGLWAKSGAKGSLTVSNSAVVETLNSSSTFTFNYPGTLDHFAISLIPSPQTNGTAITGITLTAQDANNNTVMGFTGTVTYSGTAGITGTSGSFTAGVLSNVSVTPTVTGNNLTFVVTGPAGSGSKTGTATFSTVNNDTDSVGDGIPDWWRAHYFGGNGKTTNAQSCATCDADGTGQNNLFKYTADLNPTNPASRLAIISITTITNNIKLIWIGGFNAWQFVECHRNLTNANSWNTIFTNTPPTPVTNTFVHTGAVADTNLFYRINAYRTLGN